MESIESLLPSAVRVLDDFLAKNSKTLKPDLLKLLVTVNAGATGYLKVASDLTRVTAERDEAQSVAQRLAMYLRNVVHMYPAGSDIGKALSYPAAGEAAKEEGGPGVCVLVHPTERIPEEDPVDKMLRLEIKDLRAALVKAETERDVALKRLKRLEDRVEKETLQRLECEEDD